MVGINPNFDWSTFGGNALQDLGYGLSSSPTLGGALGQATQRNVQLSSQRAADAKTRQQTNATVKLLQAKAPDLAAALTNGVPLDAVWGEYLKRTGPKDPIPLAQGSSLVDPTTGKPIATNGGGPAMPYDGTSMDAQNSNILLQGDPSSAEYAYAYSLATAPKMTMQQTPNGMVPVWQTPQLQGIRPPTYRGAQQASAAAPVTGLQARGADVAPIGAFGSAPAPATGAPAGITVGSALPGTKAAPTESQARYDMLGTVLTKQLPSVLQNFDAMADPKQQMIAATGKFGHWAQSDEYQKAEQGIRASVGNIVYALSGAGTSDKERQGKIDELTPHFGDKPGLIAQKKQSLVNYVLSVAAASNDPALVQQAQRIAAQLSAGGGMGGAQPFDMGGGITIQEIP